MSSMRATAAADKIHPVIGHKAFQRMFEIAGAQRIMRFSIDQFRQTGIRLHTQQARPIIRQPFHMFRHFARTRGAIHAQKIHPQRFNNRRDGGNIGTDQHGADGFDCDGHENGAVDMGM